MRLGVHVGVEFTQEEGTIGSLFNLNKGLVDEWTGNTAKTFHYHITAMPEVLDADAGNIRIVRKSAGSKELALNRVFHECVSRSLQS